MVDRAPGVSGRLIPRPTAASPSAAS